MPIRARLWVLVGIVLVVLAGGLIAAGTALRPRPAVSTENDALEAYRGMPRNFQSLRLFVQYGRLVQDENGWQRDPAICDSPMSWACLDTEGKVVVTLLADGRTTVDLGMVDRTRRFALLPSGAITYDPSRPPGEPSSPVPLGELEAPVRALDALLRSGLGTGTAVKGTAAELGIDDDSSLVHPSYTWYRLREDVPLIGQRDVELALDSFSNSLLRVRIRDGDRMHVLRMSPHLLNFEVEPRWFDTNLERLLLPWYAGEDQLEFFPGQTGLSREVE